MVDGGSYERVQIKVFWEVGEDEEGQSCRLIRAGISNMFEKRKNILFEEVFKSKK